jgi:hypothetical protein
MGGMMVATFLAIFFVPTFYHWLVEWRLERRSHDELVNEVKHLRDVKHHVPQTPGHPPHPPVAPQGASDD